MTMLKEQYIIKEMTPPVQTFNMLREIVGWGEVDEDLIGKGLENSLYSLCLFNQDKIIGICRLVGDGALKIYIEELIVHPNYQRKGLGSKMMKKMMDYISKNYKKGCKIGLFANSGLEKFYNKFGFVKRRDNMPGMEHLC